MKKTLKIAALVTIIALGLFTLTGCGKDEEKTTKKQDLSAYAGTYEGQYTKLVGDTKKVEEEFSIELKADGTGVHNRDGASYNIEWSLDGENFKMTDKFGSLTIDYTGTLKDGTLDIFNGDPENIWTYEYVYEKQ